MENGQRNKHENEIINIETLGAPSQRGSCPTPSIKNNWVVSENDHVTSEKGKSKKKTNTRKTNDGSTNIVGLSMNIKNRSKSLVRDFITQMKRDADKHHPADRPLSPQLLLKDGKMEVWNPDRKMKAGGSVEEDEIFSTRRQLIGFSRSQKRLKLFAIKNDLFQETIKDIESAFGSGVASVFSFMKWIIIHNMLLFLLWFLFLTLPAITFHQYEKLSKAGYRFENLLEGTGPLEILWFFYGNYPAKYGSYRVDMAYTILAILTFFGTFFLLLRSMAKLEQPPSGSPLSLLVFASCNFSIRSQFERESYKSDVSTHAKDCLSEAKTKVEALSRQSGGLFKLFIKRSIAWLISLGLTAGACLVIYYFMKNITVFEYIGSYTDAKFVHNFLKSSGLSVIFCIINAAVPPIIESLVKMEGYHKVYMEIRVNVIRVFFLRFLSIIVLLITLYSTVTSGAVIPNIIINSAGKYFFLIFYIILISFQVAGMLGMIWKNNKNFKGCGGTFIGQEFYKIIVFDILFVIISTAALRAAWFLIRKKKKEPKVSSIVLQVVYRQVLVWSGTFFCPIMPLLGIVSQSMVYYTHYFLLKRTCKASAKRFRNDGAIYFYKACIAFALGALLVPVITILGSNYVSVGELNHTMLNGTSCGPFKDKTPLAILNEISSNKEKLPNWVFLTLNWFTSAAAFPSILVLSIIVYVQTVRVTKHKKKFKELQIDHNKFKMKSNARLLRAGEAV